MKISLRSVLEQWTLYRRAAEEINRYVLEGRYAASHLGLLTGSLEDRKSTRLNSSHL